MSWYLFPVYSNYRNSCLLNEMILKISYNQTWNIKDFILEKCESKILNQSYQKINKYHVMILTQLLRIFLIHFRLLILYMSFMLGIKMNFYKSRPMYAYLANFAFTIKRQLIGSISPTCMKFNLCQLLFPKAEYPSIPILLSSLLSLILYLD